jgi:hypothetical protein
MEEKISAKAIDHYSNIFASKLADSFFQKKEKIDGREILALSEIKQVNLLVVKELMRLWNAEQQKWQSPFFDYGAEEVQKSREQFKNTLSNHILISKKDFLPLLRLAVSQTLFLILAPYDFFSNVLDSKGNGLLKVSDLKNETRYLKINKAPLEKLVEKLEERKLEVATGNEAFALLDHILEEVNFTPEDVEGYIATFSKLVPLNVDSLIENNEPPREVKPNAPVAEEVKRKEFRIKDSLTINQKFMFTKILFSGDFEVFSEAIDRFDKFNNLNQALNYIDENYSQWDKESEEYEEFYAILQRKFS